MVQLLDDLRRRGVTRFEATRPAEDAWRELVRTIGDLTLFDRADSWYVGANIPGKPRVFMPYMGGMPAYRAKCKAVAESGYDGFATA